MGCSQNNPLTGLICGNVNRANNQRDSVVNVASTIPSENETVSFVIVTFVSVAIVTVSFVRTKVPHSLSTSLTLCENVNTPLSFFFRISPTESLNETVSFVIVTFVSVTLVTVSFVRTKVPHSLPTSLTLCENLNTPLSFFRRIFPTESLKLTWP